MVMTMVIKQHNTVYNRQTIKASEFKAKCLALMDQVASTGEVFVITKNGQPVAELRRHSGDRLTSPFGLHPKLEILGDVLSPLEAEPSKRLDISETSDTSDNRSDRAVDVGSGLWKVLE